jgi:hypothetical protein
MSTMTSEMRRAERMKTTIGVLTVLALIAKGPNEVSVENTDQGVAVTFTNDRSQDVVELRERVRGMAAMHEHHAGMKSDGMMGGQGGMSAMPPSTVSVVDVPQGARLELVANEAADVDSLRQHASMHAEHMRGRQGCPMIGAPAA